MIVFVFHYYVGISLSAHIIKRHGVRLNIKGLLLFYIKILTIALLAVIPAWFSQNYLPGGNIIDLCIVLSITSLLFILLARILKVNEVSALIKAIVNKKE